MKIQCIMQKIYKKLLHKRFEPAHVAEVGVYRPETSNVYDYIVLGVRCTLVEPDPDSVKLIRERFSKKDNVTLHPVAVYDFNGEVELVRRAASTYVSELSNSPAIANNGYILDVKDKFVVEAKTFDEIDDGTIDLLTVDVEGSEWFVIKHLVSRPFVISVETHGAIYVNLYLQKIMEWMKTNSYMLWYKDKSDSVFVKRGALQVGMTDKIKLVFMDAYLRIRRARKKINQVIRSKFSVNG